MKDVPPMQRKEEFVSDMVQGKVKKYTCSHEGCTHQVQTGGVCSRHSAEQRELRCYIMCTFTKFY